MVEIGFLPLVCLPNELQVELSGCELRSFQAYVNSSEYLWIFVSSRQLGLPSVSLYLGATFFSLASVLYTNAASSCRYFRFEQTLLIFNFATSLGSTKRESYTLANSSRIDG